MKNHTPGPWSVGKDTRIIGANSQRVAVADDNELTPGMANARLIAASPDLLAALIAFRDGGPQGGQNFAEWHQSYAPAIELARAAIAKATGQ